MRRDHWHDGNHSNGGACGFRVAVPPRLARRRDGARLVLQRRCGGTRGPSRSPRLGGWEPCHHHRRRVIPRLHGSTSELPPATSHGYAEWDFSGVPDPVMFQRFLDAADYWFGYSDNSSTGSYDPAWECFVVLANDQANAANMAEAGDGEVPPGPGTGPHQGAGPSAPPPSPPRGADINA
jgi:hypothetical protein